MMSSPGRVASILVPLDGSPLAEQALPIAVAIAERARCRIKLVLVHQPLILAEPGPDYAKLELAMQKADREYLRSVVARLRERLGRALSAAVLRGPTVQTLAKYVRELGTDLVVMTTHGRGGLQRAWLGSVTDQLIRTSEVPILVVRPREDRTAESAVNLGEILVPLDGSPLAEAVLEPAAALARLWDGEVSLVQVVRPVVLDTTPFLPSVGYSNEATAIQRELAQDYIRDVAERLRDSGVKASGIAVIGGGIADTLINLARPERVGLVAVATHGRGGLRRLALGSVADKLVRAAEVPVLVVRPVARRSKRNSEEGHVSVGTLKY
ncbi:MAG TPA: universal stress protein [Gemmatimonadales bacterium]